MFVNDWKMKFVASVVLVLIVLTEIKCSEDEIEPQTITNDTNFYTAAVVELNPPGDKFTDPQEIVDANLNEYLKWIAKAAESGADILVFPEATLNYHGIENREKLSQVAVELITPPNDANASECDYSHNVILSELSFAASNASLYVLVNVVEKETCNESESCLDGFELFNANLVFDRRGCVVSRYRKFNLFHEPNMNVTSEPEIAIFETDFGVTFGHFICFDILFESPALKILEKNVSHILYPSMWFSETPFLTSVQIQQSFAERNNIVLLSAGANSPQRTNTGSGIFAGRHGAIEKIISWKNESRMLIAEVPKDVDDLDYEPPEPVVEPYAILDMDLLPLWHIPMIFSSHPLTENFSVISEDIKLCGFQINFTRLEIPKYHVGYDYKFVSFFGSRSFAGEISGGEIHCAIVACVDNHTCGKRFENSGNLVPSVEFHSISIDLKVADDPRLLIMPTTLDTSILPLAKNFYDFEHESEDGDRKYHMELTEDVDKLFAFGIYGRNFGLDAEIPAEIDAKSSDGTAAPPILKSSVEDETEDNNLSLKMTIYVVLMVVLCIITAIMTYRKLQHPYIKPDVNKRKN